MREPRRVGKGDEPSRLERVCRLGIVGEGRAEGLVPLRLGLEPVEDGVEQIGPVGVDEEVEDRRKLHPAPREDAAVLLPEPRRPLRLAADVLEA